MRENQGKLFASDETANLNDKLICVQSMNENIGASLRSILIECKMLFVFGACDAHMHAVHDDDTSLSHTHTHIRRNKNDKILGMH